MSNPAIFFDDWQPSTPFVIPLLNSSNYEMGISTRLYNGTILWGDGTKQDFSPLKNTDTIVTSIGVPVKTYSPNFTGDIKVYLKGGLKDIYSFSFKASVVGSDFQQGFNIKNLGLFLAQMPNLYSYRFEIYAYSSANRQPTIIGDFAQSPDSVERILIRAIDVKNRATALVLNFNNFKNTSKLKWFRKENGGGTSDQNALRFLGDIAKIPPLCTHFYIQPDFNYSIANNSALTYTSGKFWPSSFDTLQIPIPLTTLELDNLLIDLNNSITTKIGEGVIYLGGYRSRVSDTAVASLKSKGFTVNAATNPLNVNSFTDSAILRLDFQNNFDVYSNSGLNIATGGNWNPPTFALSGRKPGEYCAVFNGSQSIKTTTNLPVNSDKLTIAFWMKTTQTSAGIIVELSQNTNTNNAFSAYLNDNVANSIQFNSINTGVNKSARTGANNGAWKHFVAVIDRAQNGANEILIYENGSLVSFTKPDSTDNNGNFANNILFIGQRAGSTVGFNGSLTKLKIYNYPFTPTEVSNLYNSEL